MKTDVTAALRQAQERFAAQADKLEELGDERAARLHVSVAELQAYTYKNGDASFLCVPPEAPQAG